MHPQFTTKDLERFWSHVDKSGDCWIWTSTTNHGYGRFTLCHNGRMQLVRAHRFAYIITYGPIPEDKPLVCHSCDNKPCVRPEHLFAGTALDNERDKYAKGRGSVGTKHYSHTHPEKLARGERNGKYTHPEKTPRGEAHGQAKLTDMQAKSIRQAVLDGISQAALARQHRVSKRAIWAIVKGETWKHV